MNSFFCDGCHQWFEDSKGKELEGKEYCDDCHDWIKDGCPTPWGGREPFDHAAPPDLRKLVIDAIVGGEEKG